MLRLLRWGYIVGLHFILFVLIVKTDAIDKIERRLGIYEIPEIDNVWYNQLIFQRRIDDQLPPGVLVFLGDSLTQGFDISRFGLRAVNYGIGGDTTVGVLHRLESYRTIATSSGVVLLIGINDILRARPTEEITQNLEQIVRRIAGSTQLIVIGILPVDEEKLRERIYTTQPVTNAALREMNTELAKMCARQRRCRYVDAWPQLAPDGSLKAEYHDGDGLHLSRLGYERLAAAIGPVLSK